MKRLLDFGNSSQTQRKPSADNHFPQLIPATEKKKNLTPSRKLCYKNEQRLESRYRCNECIDNSLLCAASCFKLIHKAD